ncbi:MAG: D-alanyl-D-alanine carboxypeptidase [Chromatiaceae bacterium]|jgi:D-alanyl-D-alanine carboxypeptidase (penicillin-binding protein 5/6)|nr:D-alanyl-D-alanine carboxypeptidase [Chromatiaceae bacterium]
MKSIIVALALALLAALAGSAAAQDPASGAEQIPIPDPPQLDVKGYLLVDHNSGMVLAASNADERLEPASLTKIMTAYVVFRELAKGSLSLDDQVLISEKAWRTEGSRMFVDLGKQVAVRDLLRGVIIQSGNDASVALAEHIAGSEATFAELMNTHAKRLGMTNSHFMNSDGLPHPEQYSTARDMALVTAATIREFPDYYAWYSEKEFFWNNIKQPNRNLLLNRDPSVDGVKTGHTKAAGYCLVSSAKREGTRLTSVVMGATGPEARAQASLALLNYGFRFYESHQLYAGGQPVETLRVYKGDSKELPVGPAEDLWVSTPRRQYDKLSAHLEKRPDLQAPIAQGEAVGEIVVSLEGKEVRRVPLVALKEVAEGGIWAKARDGVLQWF